MPDAGSTDDDSDRSPMDPAEIASSRMVTDGPADTFALGENLGVSLEPGDVVGLTGGLGAGKTCLVKGICFGLGVPAGDPVSPTFSIVNEYEGRCPVYHIDAYRIGSPSELENIGLDDYLDGSGVCLIEWADRIVEALAGVGWTELRLEIVGPSRREIRYVPHERNEAWPPSCGLDRRGSLCCAAGGRAGASGRRPDIETASPDRKPHCRIASKGGL